MNTGALKSLDWAIIGGYLVFVVWLGARFARRQTSSGHYFLGGGRLPGWAVGMSLFATIISSWAFLALPGKAFRSDLQYLLAVPGLPLVAWLAARWVIPMFRKRIRLSAHEYSENRFGLVARVYGNLAFVVVHFGKMAAILYLLCLALAEMTGWNIFLLTGLIGLIGTATVAYTFFGGIEGVVWTDVAQGGLLLFGGLVSIVVILLGAPDGTAAVVATARDGGKFRLSSGEFRWDSIGVVVLVCFGLDFYLQKYDDEKARHLFRGVSRPGFALPEIT